VWFDALPNYLTATGFPDGDWETRWPAQLHVVGKDITRLHCVVWPAMLDAAGLALPERVWAHGFVSLGGERFSKSAGVRLELGEAIDRFGADPFRYFLLAEVPFDADGNFSWERFEERYNADLANALGNLASRVIAMVEKYRDGLVPSGTRPDLDERAREAVDGYHGAMDGSRGFLLHEGLRHVLALVQGANFLVQTSRPWELAKQGRDEELDAVLGHCVRQLATIAVLLAPFMPEKAEELWRQLGGPGAAADQRFPTLHRLDPSGWRVRKGEALFPREQKAASR
jgi:methionyl-tRNA synthetase